VLLAAQHKKTRYRTLLRDEQKLYFFALSSHVRALLKNVSEFRNFHNWRCLNVDIEVAIDEYESANASLLILQCMCPSVILERRVADDFAQCDYFEEFSKP
jgi:hypothetical protein